ncbi:MAG: hypothetical protein KAS96_08620, partial [Planctomycetes bacterium]|nr:hypothetical protein [Planctomycetota bacterium]
PRVNNLKITSYGFIRGHLLAFKGINVTPMGLIMIEKQFEMHKHNFILIPIKFFRLSAGK